MYLKKFYLYQYHIQLFLVEHWYERKLLCVELSGSGDAMGTDVEMSKRKPDISDTFRLAVNTNKNRIWNILKKRYRELSELPVNSKRFILNNNNVVLDYNEDFDKEMSIFDEDAYLYYEYNMDFYPKIELSLESQITFAKELVEIFRGGGVEAEIISEFEHLLDG